MVNQSSTIADLPAVLLDLIVKKAPEAPSSSAREEFAGRRQTGAQNDEAVRRYAFAALDKQAKTVEAAGEGQRNATLNNAALSLGHFVGAGALGESTVRAVLEDAAAANGLVKDDGILSVRATISSGLRAGMAQPADLSKIRRGGNRLNGKGRQRETAAFPESDLTADGDSAPSSGDPGATAADDISDEVFEECAKFDQTDTDNAVRLIKYFGRDIVVRAEGGVEGGSWLTWTGTHWDLDGGAAGVRLLAQRVGDMILREAEFMQPTDAEQRLLYAAGKATEKLKAEGDSITAAERDQIEDLLDKAEEVRKAVEKRRGRREQFGLSSKNRNRIKSMLELAAPRLRRLPENFNEEALLVTTKTHTLRFIKIKGEKAHVEAILGHCREDFCTSFSPVAYDPAARAPKWRGFLERFQPDLDSRRTLRMFSGLGLTGLALQWFMFHYGNGSNGKSVFLETLCRVLGDLACGLPIESILETGKLKSGGQASPDIARLYDKRMVRVTEIPAGGELATDAVKRLTGGEKIPVRTLYKSFFEFQPICKPHFSTNGEPRVKDASNGVWRRMLRNQWPVEIPEEERRDSEEVIEEFMMESSGILNWAIGGVIDYLDYGRMFVADAIRKNTQAYREGQDQLIGFVADCLEIVKDAEGNPDHNQSVGAQRMYDIYKEWCADAGKDMWSQTTFGTHLAKMVPRSDGRIRFYLGVKLKPRSDEGGA